MARKSGKDGFRIAKATVVCTGVCNVHFRANDILRVPGGESVNFTERSSPTKIE